METEDRLVERASRGDGEAIDELLARHLPHLLGFVRRRAGELAAKESSSDVVQSVCREVLEGLADGRVEYRGEQAFRAWLFEAALFKLRNRRRYWRAERRDVARERRLAGADDAGAPLDALAGTSRTPSREAAAHEDRARLAALLEQLPERYRIAVELARIRGLGHAEIAEQLGISEAASRQLLTRALARLATLGARDEA